MLIDPNHDALTHGPDALKALLVGIQHRGRDATGIAWWQEVTDTDHPAHGEARIFTNKDPQLASAFILDHEDAITTAGKSGLAIVHTRFPTQGSKMDRVNNHPIDTNSIVGVHNGVISNDKEIFRTHNLDRRGEVDSEAIFALLSAEDVALRNANIELRMAAFGKVLDKMRGSMAVAFMSKFEPGVLYLGKGNGNPIVIGQASAGRVLLFASEVEAIKAGFEHLKIEQYSVVHATDGDLRRVTADSLRTVQFRPPVQHKISPPANRPAATTWSGPNRMTPRGAHADKHTWLDITNDDIERFPALAQSDVWEMANDAGLELLVGCFSEVDQALLLNSLAHNLFMDPFVRTEATDVAASQHHLRQAIEYLIDWYHNDKDTRKFTTVMTTIYDNLGANFVGDIVKWTPSGQTKPVEVRIVGFGRPEVYTKFPQGPRVFVQYKEQGDTVLRSVGKAQLKPNTVKPAPDMAKILGWIEDAALIIAAARSRDLRHPLEDWLDPSEPLSVADLKTASDTIIDDQLAKEQALEEPPANDTVVPETMSHEDAMAMFGWPGYY